MSLEAKHVEIEPALRDLRNRTLKRLPGDFSRLVYCSLEELIEELRNYISSTSVRQKDFLQSWTHLGSYRVTIPSDCDETDAEIFLSNVKIALAILQTRQESALQDERSA